MPEFAVFTCSFFFVFGISTDICRGKSRYLVQVLQSTNHKKISEFGLFSQSVSQEFPASDICRNMSVSENYEQLPYISDIVSTRPSLKPRCAYLHLKYSFAVWLLLPRFFSRNLLFEKFEVFAVQYILVFGLNAYI